MTQHMKRRSCAVVAALLALILLSASRFPEALEMMADLSLAAVATGATAFALLYGLRSKWRTNEVGVVFFTNAVVLPLVLWHSVVEAWVESDYPGRNHFGLVVHAASALVYIPMLVVLARHQSADRRFAREQGVAEEPFLPPSKRDDAPPL